MAWIFIDTCVECMVYACVVYISVLVVVVLGSCEQIFTALGTALGNIHTHTKSPPNCGECGLCQEKSATSQGCLGMFFCWYCYMSVFSMALSISSFLSVCAHRNLCGTGHHLPLGIMCMHVLLYNIHSQPCAPHTNVCKANRCRNERIGKYIF